MKFAELMTKAIDELKDDRANIAMSIAKNGIKEKKQLADLADLQQSIAAMEAVKSAHKGFD